MLIHTTIDPRQPAARVRLMRASSLVTLAALVLAGMMPLSLQADYLKNTDFKEGISCWRGDGKPAFLNPDGTEGAEGDKGVTPVIKIALSHSQPRCIYQDYETRDKLPTQHIKVDVFASSDFKRTTDTSYYTSSIHWKPGGVWYWSGEAIPNVDFWIRGSPGFIYKLADLKPGEWVTVDGFWDSAPSAQDRSVYFIVPAGEGAIYIKNPSASP